MAGGDRQQSNMIGVEFPGQKRPGRQRERKLPNLCLLDRLPQTHDAPPKLRRNHDPPRLGRQSFLISQSPNKSVGIEQDLHYQKRSSISFGRGSLKSSEITILPLADPNLNFLVADFTGTSLATGVPALAITTSSPMATRSSNRERCVLAS